MSTHRRSVVAVVAVVGGAILLTIGCSASSELSAEDRLDAQTLVVERAADAMIELSDGDRDCVVDSLTTAELDGLRGEVVGPIAEAVVSCVGVDLLGASVLGQQSGEISATSLDCVVDELGRGFVVDLVASAMSGKAESVESDLAVARALAVCLDLDELL